MKPDVIQLTKDIVSISSVSHQSNTMVCDLLEETLKKCEFEVERLQFIDQKGEAKISLVAKKGERWFRAVLPFRYGTRRRMGLGCVLACN